jgi:hypothetical protein
MTVKNTTIICPNNDGESKTIIEIAERFGFDLRISKQTWGAALEHEPQETFENLKHNIIIVEIPGQGKEAELENKYTLFIIDHHAYHPSLDRRHAYSSLEQFADLIGCKLSRFEMGIAVNDRSFIGGLMERGYSKEEIDAIRMHDLKAQKYEEKDFAQLREIYKAGKEHHGCCVIRTAYERTSYLSDIHFWENEKRKTKLDLIVLKACGEWNMALEATKKYEGVSYIGHSAVVNAFYKKFGGYAGGDEAYSMYWGKELQSNEERNNFQGLLQKQLEDTDTNAAAKNAIKTLIQNLTETGDNGE